MAHLVTGNYKNTPHYPQRPKVNFSIPQRHSYRTKALSHQASPPKPSIQKQFDKRVEKTLVWNDKFKKKAEKLIFGARKYAEFTPKEKAAVDFYQEKILEVDGGFVLPNTRAELEEEQFRKVYQRYLLADKKHSVT